MTKERKYILNIAVDGIEYKYNLIDGTYMLINEAEGKREFYTETDEDDFQMLLKYNYDLRMQSDFLCITIAITKACNFRCVYCFEEHTVQKLDISTIDAVCNIIKEYWKRKPNLKNLVLIWFGGEPTLYIKYIEMATIKFKKIASELQLFYSSKIISNGYCVNKIVPYIKQWHVTDIQITFDGTKDIHDIRRKSMDGRGTFDTIINNILLIDEKVDLVIRANVDQANIEDIYNLYDFVKQLKISQQVRLFFQPMLVEDYGGEAKCYLGKIPQDEMMYERYVNLLCYTHALEKPCFIRAFCNVDFPGSIVINSDGLVYKCWAEIEDKRLAFDKINIDNYENIVNKMQDNLFYIKNEKCMECKFFPICMGGCKYMKYSEQDCQKRKRMIIKEIEYCIKNAL